MIRRLNVIAAPGQLTLGASRSIEEMKKMNRKKLLSTFTAIFVAVTVLGYIIHAVLLSPDYQSVSHLYRRQPLMPFLLLGNASFSLAFVWIYSIGARANPWVGQGLRFGVAVWLLWAVPTFLIQYAGQPFPASMIAKEIGLELLDMLILGLLTAALYRKQIPYSG